MSTVSADITLAMAHGAPGPDASLAATMRSWLGSLRAVGARRTTRAAGNQFTASHTQSVARRIRERLQRSDYENRPMTMVVFELDDLPLVQSVFGAAMAREVLAHVTGKLQRLAGRSGLAERTAASEFTVLLPWADAERAVDTVHAVFGKPCRVELEMDHAEILLLPHIEVSTLDCDSTSIDATYQKLRHQIAQARLHDEQRRAHDTHGGSRRRAGTARVASATSTRDLLPPGSADHSHRIPLTSAILRRVRGTLDGERAAAPVTADSYKG